MSAQLKENLAIRGCPPDNDTVSLGSDLVWGVTSIAKEINRNPRQTFHLLENGRLPAKKVGGRWCASRTGLQKFFANLVAGEVA
jgi:hypothetical protein